MTDAEDVYAIFEKCGLQMPKHIKNILRKLGYRSLRSFTQEHPVGEEKLQDLEDNVRLQPDHRFASPSMIDKLNKHEDISCKNIYLGKFFLMIQHTTLFTWREIINHIGSRAFCNHT
jgi:hypothetical protein